MKNAGVNGVNTCPNMFSAVTRGVVFSSAMFWKRKWNVFPYFLYLKRSKKKTISGKKMISSISFNRSGK
jgi:membrane protein CcdC involved in cytochrome C biogenesis